MTTRSVHNTMSHIRSKDTKPEWIVRRWLWHRGYRYRKNDRRLPGTPDLVLKKYATVIFIHGCFWHGHEHIVMPHTNADFWRRKIERNRRRDELCRQKLKDMGWNVMTVWECQLEKKLRQATLLEIEHLLNRSYLGRMARKGQRREAQKYGEVPEYTDMAAEERQE